MKSKRRASTSIEKVCQWQKNVLKFGTITIFFYFCPKLSRHEWHRGKELVFSYFNPAKEVGYAENVDAFG